MRTLLVPPSPSHNLVVALLRFHWNTNTVNGPYVYPVVIWSGDFAHVSIISYTTEYSDPVSYHGSDGALPCFVRPGRRMSAQSCLPLAFQGADGWSPPAGHMQEAESSTLLSHGSVSSRSSDFLRAVHAATRPMQRCFCGNSLHQALPRPCSRPVIAIGTESMGVQYRFIPPSCIAFRQNAHCRVSESNAESQLASS